MTRVRISRFRDRASYKSSELVGLFLISVMGGMVFFGLCWLVDFFLQRVFGIGVG